MATDPLVLVDDVKRATERFLATAAALDGVVGPSRLPGWTRGHVLTHVARNADSLVNLLTWARTGVETPQYPSAERRDADIEAGAARPLREQLDDLAAAGGRFDAATAAMPPEAWPVPVRWRSGQVLPAAYVMWARLLEVEIHHVDLGAGYTPADWPRFFAIRTLRQGIERPGAPRVVVRSPEVGHDLPVADDVTGPVVAGPAWAAAAWLTGRSDGTGLTVDPPGALPPVASWG